jgi:hypothetical protein
MDIHELITSVLNPFHNPPDVNVLLTGPECGGTRQNPLFFAGERSRGTRLCCVDILIEQCSVPRVVVEIETQKTNVGPFYISGKYLPVAMSNGPDLTMVQIVLTEDLPAATAKIRQYKKIEQWIQQHLNGAVKRYELIAGNLADFGTEGSSRARLLSIIQGALQSAA